MKVNQGFNIRVDQIYLADQISVFGKATIHEY